MRRRGIAGMAFCVIGVLGIGLSLRSADKPPKGASMEFRRKFIDDFDHIILDTTAGDGMLLRILVEASGATRGIEVGTARGFGAMNMGIAFERTGGHLFTVDIDAGMVKKARANLKTLALGKTVTVIHGDALKVLPRLEGAYDFIFIDAVKRDYFKYLKAVEGRLQGGSIVAADNTISSAGSMPDFLARLFDSGAYEAVTVRASMKKNDGVTFACKLPRPAGGSAVAKTREALLNKLRRQRSRATVIDSILLRILARARGAKRALAVTRAGDEATINMGVALEATGGKLLVVDPLAKAADRTAGNIKTARLEKTVTIIDGPALKVLGDLEGEFDFLFLDGAKGDYLKCLKAVEARLKPRSVVVADNTILSTDKMQDFLDYLFKSPNYDAVTLRAERKSNKDGMTVACKIK